MLDMGFIHDIRKIVARAGGAADAAVLGHHADARSPRLAGEILHDPVRVEIAAQTRRPSTASTRASTSSTRRRSAALLARPARRAGAVARVIVFTRTKHGADRVAEQLDQARHRRRGDPRQQVARARASGRWRASAAARPGCWSRPTSPRAASTSTASPT